MSQNYEQTWEEFWKDICTNEDGSINLDQIKKELSDFHFVMNQVPEVYCHVTNNRLSKCTYFAKDVIREVDACVDELVSTLKSQAIEAIVKEIEFYEETDYIAGLKEAIEIINKTI